MKFEGSVRIIVKPNAKKNEILGFDKDRKAYRVCIKAPAENNKANIELIKFFSKLSKKDVRFVSGQTSKTKVIRFT